MQNTLSYKSYLKSPFLSIKHNTYFDVYDNLFSKYIGKEIIFVEVGILDGGSLFMWRDFFGKKARIIGIDLNPNAKKWEEHGFEIFIGSQSDEVFWNNFIEEVGPVDLLLDDGGHTYEQQIITTEYLISNIKDGGMLVVEDTHTSYMNGFGPKKYSFVEYTKKMIDNINYRFGEFKKDKAENRVWSIESFESIVAFKVNRPFSLIKSECTENNGTRDDDEKTKDFRHSDNKSLVTIKSIAEKLRFLENVPLLLSIYQIIIQKISNKKFKGSKYFK
jgi:hypothetical protein